MRGIVILVLVAVSGALATEQVVLEADGDSYVKYYEEWESEPEYADDNFGGEPLMYVLDNYYQWGEEIEIAYMHFDFSGLGDYDGEYLVGAQLVLHAESSASGVQHACAVAAADGCLVGLLRLERRIQLCGPRRRPHRALGGRAGNGLRHPDPGHRAGDGVRPSGDNPHPGDRIRAGAPADLLGSRGRGGELGGD